MPQTFNAEGKIYSFPDDMDRNDIRSALNERQEKKPPADYLDFQEISKEIGVEEIGVGTTGYDKTLKELQRRQENLSTLQNISDLRAEDSFPPGKSGEVYDRLVESGEIKKGSAKGMGRFLPDIFSEPAIFINQSPGDIMKFSTLAAVTPDTEELAQITKSIFPKFKIKKDIEGNYILQSPEGVRATLNKKDFSTTDAVQLGSIVGAFSPAGAVTKQMMGQGVKHFLKQGLQGSVAGGLTQAGIESGQAESGGKFDTGQVALTTALFPVSQVGYEKIIAPIFTKSLSKVAGKNINVLDDTGQISGKAVDEIARVMEKKGITADQLEKSIKQELQTEGLLTPEQVKRFNLFARRGVPATRANVTQKTDDFRQLGDAEKSSGLIAERLSEQDEQLFKAAREGADNIGPATHDLLETNASIFSAVDNVVTDLDNIVFKAYSSAREAAKGKPNVTLNGFLKVVNDNRGSERITKGLISAIRGELKNKGILKKGAKLDINRYSARSEATRKITVSQAEEVRQALNQFFESTTPQGRVLIRKFKDAIDDDVAKVVGEDVFKEARQAKIKFHSVISKASRDKFDKSKGSVLEDIIYNKVPEDKILQKLLVSRDDDFKVIHHFLLNESGAQGIQTFNNIKAQVLRNAIDKATTQAKREGGQASFNARSFETALKALKKESGSKKFDLLFNADEKQLIEDIVEIGRLRIPIKSVALGSGPSGAAIMGQSLMENLRHGDKAKAVYKILSGGAKEVERQLYPLKGLDKTLNVGHIKNALENIRFLSTGATQAGRRISPELFETEEGIVVDLPDDPKHKVVGNGYNGNGA